jgi:hypothetical protein
MVFLSGRAGSGAGCPEGGRLLGHGVIKLLRNIENLQ